MFSSDLSLHENGPLDVLICVVLHFCVLYKITGGAGFVGSHLTDKLMMDGHEVTVVDNFFTGRKRNVEHWIGHENFELINHDVVEPLYIEGKDDV